MKVLFVIDTFHRGRHVLVELPLVSRKNSHISENNDSWNRLLAEIFSHKNKLATNYIFDILIDNSRYISYPLWIDQNKYYRNGNAHKLVANECDAEGNGNNSEEEEMKSSVVKLKMFNIVLVYENNNSIIADSGNLSIIYYVVESFSQYLVFEEYRNDFLGREILNLLKLVEKILEVYEDVGDHENISKSIGKVLSDKNEKGSNLVKNLVRFYEDLKAFRFFRIPINNKYDFRAPAKLLNLISEVDNYHSLIVYKRKQLDEWLSHNYDIDPFIQLFVNIINPFKSFIEISLEFKISLDYVKLIARQMHCLNLGKIAKKFNNNTILFPNSKTKIKKELELEFYKNYNFNLWETLNLFTHNKSLNKIFKLYFDQITNEKFINLVNFLVSNELLSQCSIYILPKIPLKRKYNVEKKLLNNSLIIFDKIDRIKFILNEIDANNEGNINHQINSSSFKNKPVVYLEEVIASFKTLNLEDYQILNNIFYLLSPEYDFDEICYFTGYKDDLLKRVIKKYIFLFNVIVCAIE